MKLQQKLSEVYMFFQSEDRQAIDIRIRWCHYECKERRYASAE